MADTILRTPDERFASLPDFSFAPHYVDVDGIRVAYIDEGPRDAAPVLLLHGEPSWSFLYRKMIPGLVAAGHRVVAPDLVGFGRSDKPAERADYTYQRHVDWTWSLVTALGLGDITLVCQDWGGLLGLRLVGEHPERFARVLATNTGLPTGDAPLSEALAHWQRQSQQMPRFPTGKIIASNCRRGLSPAAVAAYDAPYPDETYQAGARQFPMLIPATPDDPAAPACRAAWEALRRFDKPFLTVATDGDPFTAGFAEPMKRAIPGAKGLAHPSLTNAGHFVQEDCGDELARITVGLVRGS